MATGKHAVSARIQVDMLAQDGEGKAVLLVEVKAREGRDEDLNELRESLEAANTIIPFALIANLERIRVFEWDGATLSGPVFDEETRTILRPYYEQYDEERIFEHFLRTLVESWLSDLVTQWKYPAPPGADRLASIGLVAALEGLTIQTEVLIGGHPVP